MGGRRRIKTTERKKKTSTARRRETQKDAFLSSSPRSGSPLLSGLESEVIRRIIHYYRIEK